jgi:hypothetical protein
MSKKGNKSWEDDLAKEASKERAREKSGSGGLGNRLSIKGRRFTFDQENLGRTLKCVVADFVYFNTYYKGKFNEDKVNLPLCFALSEDGDAMEAHENAAKKQSKKGCEVCPQHKWGSGRGRARACQERRRLAIIHEDDLDDIENAEVAFLELPVTSVKNWSKFLKECDEKLNRPFYSVIAELSFDEDQEWPVVVFSVEEKIKDKETVDAIMELRDDIRDQLLTPFDASSDGDDDDDEDDDDDDDDSDDEEDEDDDEDSGKSKKGKTNKRKKPKEDDDDEDDDDDDDDSDDEDDEDDDEDDDEGDEKPSRRASRKAGKGRSKHRKGRAKGDDDDDDDDDEDEDDDDEDEDDDEDDARASKRKGKRSKDDDERPKKRKGSRFGKR